jgi:hypothetical protein
MTTTEIDAMNETSNGPDTNNDEVFAVEIPDAVIERAVDGLAAAVNPTVPSAIICIPFQGPPNESAH